MATYHLYAPGGNSAIHVARFDEGRWKRVAAHVWDFCWDFGGGGAIPVPLGAGPVKPVGNGRLELRVWSKRDGSRRILLDEDTLAPIEFPDAQDPTADDRDSSWKSERSKPEIQFPLRPMKVQWLPDSGNTSDGGIC